MATKVEWESLELDDKGNNKNSKLPRGKGQNNLPPIDRLKFEAGKKYNVRPLGSPVVFYKYTVKTGGTFKTAICEDPRSCPVMKNHEIRPSERYAINVIDRLDGKIKIMEGPGSLFLPFKAYFDCTGINAGKEKGCDFNITVKGEGKDRRYTSIPTNQNVLTPEEKQLIKTQGLYKLEQIFKATPSAEIEKKLFGEVATASAPTPKKREVEETDLTEGGDVGDELGGDDATDTAAGEESVDEELDI